MKPPATLFAVLSAIAVIAAVVVGLAVIGSPGEFRMRRFDEQRATDLSSISAALRRHRLTHESLPQKLRDRQTDLTYGLKNPVARPYDYSVNDEHSSARLAEV